jgi:hypothetical protein
MGVRAGFVYKTEDDPDRADSAGHPGVDLHRAVHLRDAGLDGRAGTADDKNLTFYGVPTATYNTLDRSVVQSNTDQFARYKTIEASVNRRYSNKWSASFGGSYTMLHDFFNSPSAGHAEQPRRRRSLDLELQGDRFLRRALRASSCRRCSVTSRAPTTPAR